MASIKFTKTQTATGQLQYTYETGTHRFQVRRDPDARGVWLGEVWTLKSVGIIDPFKIADRVVKVMIGWTKAETCTLVQQYIETYE